jgi:chromosome partition protein MukF
VARQLRTPENVVALIAQRRLSVELSTVDLCFLVALYVQAEGANLTSFTEAQLEDAFAQASAIAQPGGDNVRLRATHAIQRLRDQRLLARVDGQGVVRTGEFTLSRLATGIVGFFLEEDVLTRESLGLLTGSLYTALAAVLEAARRAHGPAEWRDDVTGPLTVTAGELVAGIERRQRGLDIEQERFQAEIRGLIEADWLGAMDRCQGLLDSTSAMLRELNEVLLRDSSRLLAVLHDIEELAAAAEAADAEAAARRLMDQIDRIAAWGSARQRAWSEYFQYVHRYLRDVVRLDPTRALTQRLREQLAGSGKRFALAVAGAQPLRVLRETISLKPPRQVARPRAAWDRDPSPESTEDPQAALDAKVTRSLEAGAEALSVITADVTATVEQGDRFVEAGRVAGTVAKLTRATAERERPWVAVDGSFEIEDWKLAHSGSRGSPES